MAIRRIIVVVMLIITAAMQLTLTACNNDQSRAKKIVSLRTERKQLLDTLYQNYGGSELSKTVNSGLQKEKRADSGAENQIIQGISNLAQGADRTVFEQSVRIVGRGENLISITDKSKQFFSRSDVLKYAKRIYEIDIHLEQLGNK